VDEFFGNLSYGVFLNHFIIIWVMQKFLAVKAFGILHIIILLMSSCGLAFISFIYIERPALIWRHAIRGGGMRRKPKPAVNMDAAG
jgi:peptidoglycan/LPS O-acetylase OafA/YrhL